MQGAWWEGGIATGLLGEDHLGVQVLQVEVEVGGGGGGEEAVGHEALD